MCLAAHAYSGFRSKTAARSSMTYFVTFRKCSLCGSRRFASVVNKSAASCPFRKRLSKPPRRNKGRSTDDARIFSLPWTSKPTNDPLKLFPDRSFDAASPFREDERASDFDADDEANSTFKLDTGCHERPSQNERTPYVFLFFNFFAIATTFEIKRRPRRIVIISL